MSNSGEKIGNQQTHLIQGEAVSNQSYQFRSEIKVDYDKNGKWTHP